MATSDVVYRMNADWSIMRQLDGRNFLQDTGEPSTEWQEKYEELARKSRRIAATVEATE